MPPVAAKKEGAAKRTRKKVVKKTKATTAEAADKPARRPRKSKKTKTEDKRDGEAPKPLRSSIPPPGPWAPRCRTAPWPSSAWMAENKDVSAAQDAMLMAYWIADQLGNPDLPEAERASLRSAVHGALPHLRGSIPSLRAWAVAAAVRRNGALLSAARSAEQKRMKPGAMLDAVLDAHEEEATQLTIRQVELHSPELGAWLSELERRGRPELRSALKACGDAAWKPEADDPHDALRRLLVLVLFAAEQMIRRSALR